MRLRSSVGRAAVLQHQPPADLPDSEKPRLRDVLMQSGALSEADVDAVTEMQQRTGRLFGETCLDLGLCDADTIQAALDQQHGYALIEPGSDAVDPQVSVAYGTDPALAENMRALRARLLSRRARANDGHAMLAFIGADDGASGSVIVANFAVASAQLGFSVLLVDAAIDQPAQHRLFRRSNRIGLTTILGERDDPSVAIQDTAVPHLSLLAVGPAVPHPAEFFERNSLSGAIRAFSPPFDLVVVDAGAGSSDVSAALAVGLDGAVVITRRHKTPVRRVRRLADRLADRGVERLGTVIA